VGVVLLLVVVAVVSRVLQGGQKGDPLGGVDDGGLGLGQGIGHEVLQPHPVHHDHVGPLDGLHVGGGEGIVMEAGGLGVDQQGDLHPLRPLGDGGGEEVHRVGGGQNVEGIVLLPLGGGTGGEQKEQGRQQGGQGTFFHGIPRFFRIAKHIIPDSTWFVK